MNPVTYTVLPVALSLGVISAFVVSMTLIAGYVFTREVNKPF